MTEEHFRRRSYPWEDTIPNFEAHVPWEYIEWYPTLTSGRLRQVEAAYEPSRDRMERRPEHGSQRYPTDGAPVLNYEQMKKCRLVQIEHDCTFIEAAIAVVGKDNISGAWLKLARGAPRVKYRHSKQYIAAQPAPAPLPELEIPDLAPVAEEPAVPVPETLQESAAATSGPPKRGPGRPRKQPIEG